MEEGRARLRLLHRQVRRSRREGSGKRKGPVLDTGTGPVSSIGLNQPENEVCRMWARMRRDARDGIAYRYNKIIARRGYRLNDHKGRRVEAFLARGEHVKGFQQA